MTLIDAQALAQSVVFALAPHCERIEIAGSVRRMKAYLDDIDIVCIPRGKDLAAYAEVVNR